MGTVLNDGHPTTVAFGTPIDATILDVKTLTPPPVEGGGEIDITTMNNSTWRRKAAKTLKTMGPMTFVAAYDPGVYTNIIAAVNVEQAITITFPDTETLVFQGWIDSFVPGTHEDGEQPEATVTIIPSLMSGGSESNPTPPTA